MTNDRAPTEPATESYGQRIRNGIKRQSKCGVKFEVSPTGSMRVTDNRKLERAVERDNASAALLETVADDRAPTSDVDWLLWLADDISQRSGWSLDVPQRVRLVADALAAKSAQVEALQTDNAALSALVDEIEGALRAAGKKEVER